MGGTLVKITSRRNPVCVHIKKLGVSSSYRQSCGEFICDGIKLLEEAIKNDAEVTSVLTAVHIPFPLPLETRVYFTDRNMIDYVSPLTSSQGILFTCKTPTGTGKDIPDGTHVLLDGVQDPGNVGAVIRTANAFGIGCVILTGECADPYNPKTVRATMGAIFRQRIFCLRISELAALKVNGMKFIGAAPGESSKDISTVELRGSVIAIGSEGCGLSAQVLALCDEIVRIPIAPECESLNAAVAAGIILYLARS